MDSPYMDVEKIKLLNEIEVPDTIPVNQIWGKEFVPVLEKIINYMTCSNDLKIVVTGNKAIQLIGSNEYLPSSVLLEDDEQILEICWTLKMIPENLWEIDQMLCPEICIEEYYPVIEGFAAAVLRMKENNPFVKDILLDSVDEKNKPLSYGRGAYRPFIHMEDVCKDITFATVVWNEIDDTVPIRLFCLQIDRFFNKLKQGIDLTPDQEIYVAFQNPPALMVDKKKKQLSMVARGGFFILEKKN